MFNPVHHTVTAIELRVLVRFRAPSSRVLSIGSYFALTAPKVFLLQRAEFDALVDQARSTVNNNDKVGACPPGGTVL